MLVHILSTKRTIEVIPYKKGGYGHVGYLLSPLRSLYDTYSLTVVHGWGRFVYRIIGNRFYVVLKCEIYQVFNFLYIFCSKGKYLIKDVLVVFKGLNYYNVIRSG